MELVDIVAGLHEGTVRPQEVVKLAGSPEAGAVAMRIFTEEITGVDLGKFADPAVAPSQAYGRNIENMVGTMGIPLGVLSPIEVHGELAEGKYVVPIATTEGALVASVSRACKVLSANGGVTVDSKYHGMTRAPVLQTTGVKQSREVAEWVGVNMPLLRKIARGTSSHIDVMGIESTILGNELWLRCAYDTGEAMGMNMASKASAAIVQAILSLHPGVSEIALSGNMCVDKKPNWINVLDGRGFELNAEAFLPAKAVEKTFRTEVGKVVRVNEAKVWHGSALAGSIGANSHSANVVAGVYLATGQDAAQIVDSSPAFVKMEERDGGLYIALRMPSVMMAYIGGGTMLKGQRTAIELMIAELGVPSHERPVSRRYSQKMAEILAAAVLAGELNLAASLAAGQLVAGHEALGRGNVHRFAALNGN